MAGIISNTRTTAHKTTSSTIQHSVERTASDSNRCPSLPALLIASTYSATAFHGAASRTRTCNPLRNTRFPTEPTASYHITACPSFRGSQESMHHTPRSRTHCRLVLPEPNDAAPAAYESNVSSLLSGTPSGTRTHIFAVRGRPPIPISQMGAYFCCGSHLDCAL